MPHFTQREIILMQAHTHTQNNINDNIKIHQTKRFCGKYVITKTTNKIQYCSLRGKGKRRGKKDITATTASILPP